MGNGLYSTCGIFSTSVDNVSVAAVCSPLTKNKSTFSVYHWLAVIGPIYLVGDTSFDIYNSSITSGCFVDSYYGENGYHKCLGSRLTNEPGYLFGLSSRSW